MIIKNYRIDSKSLTVEWQSGEIGSFSHFWLRDNARDPVSFDIQSYQRELFTAMVPPDIIPDQIELANDGCSLKIKWPDLENPTNYESQFLSNYRQPLAKNTNLSEMLWNADSLNDDTIRLDFKQAISASGNTKLLEILATYGFVLISQCPHDQDSVVKIAKNIGYIRETIFGGLWEFEANANMADSAYTPKELRPHTDSTYSLDAPGLQMLLCMSYDATGGESIVVDGFSVADQLKREDEKLYNAMSRIGVIGIYKGDGAILQAERPILRHDDQGKLTQVTFNNYDRATMRLPEPDMSQLYAGIRYLDRLFNHPSYQWRYQLQAGQMLIFDNWRILHGRGAFKGKRKMAGAYINREDFMSALRKNALIDAII